MAWCGCQIEGPPCDMHEADGRNAADELRRENAELRGKLERTESSRESWRAKANRYAADLTRAEAERDAYRHQADEWRADCKTAEAERDAAERGADG